jgi:cobalt/nickel transport system permease protein|nr:energy-coupling factor ABC transporter permease [uncultured Butyrivibrio sp.]
MHMADALVAPAVAGTMYVLSTGAAGVSVKKVREENDPKKIPVMGVMGAFVFATQMLNFTIPGTGSSGHLCGGMMLSAMLGPYAGFLTMIGVLLVQCLLFADGGLLALGCNIWNMAFYGCFVGALLIWRPIMKKGASRAKIILASILGCVLTLQMGAFSVTIETLLSGVTELPFSVFVATMQPIHLAIGFVEGLITAAVLVFVNEARPELLWGVGGRDEVKVSSKEGKLSFRNTIIAIAVAAVICGGAISLFASAFPDGLEWSMEQVAGTAELEAEGGAYETAAGIQEATSLLPDYAFKNSESAVGTSFSGIVGGLVVVAVTVGACYAFRFFRKKEETAA